MALMQQKVLVTMKLPQLQNLIKRDPEGYKEEFILQLRHFKSEIEIFKLKPMKDSDRFTELVNFIAHVSPCYKDDPDTKEVPKHLLDLLDFQANILHPDVRARVLSSLILLRNRGMIDPEILLKLAFKLFSVNDKSLRATLHEYIINDIKSINSNRNDEKLNRRIQAVLFGIASDDVTVAAKKTVHILAELYRKRIWTDPRSVNVIATACTSQSTAVMVAAINFFLGIESKMLDDEDEDKEPGSKEIKGHDHSKKTKKRLRSVEKQMKNISKIQKSKENDQAKATPLFPAIQLIHDPQILVEKVFKRLRQSGERFEFKLLAMNFISRVIGTHKLILLSFYRFDS